MMKKPKGLPVGFGKTDVALTKDALIFEINCILETQISLCEQLEEQAAREDARAFQSVRALIGQLRRFAALTGEGIRQGYEEEMLAYVKPLVEGLERNLESLERDLKRLPKM